MQLPHRLLSFYGDDFTGSTDVIDVMARAGLPTVLFLSMPDETVLASFSNARVIGLAGISRSQTPAWMAENLPGIYEFLRKTGSIFAHYKVCSTFDSAPHIGNIGEAIALGMNIFENRPVPLVVGAPALHRYVAFGNLFAKMQGNYYRIDRHPVMASHPITPMREGDLRCHLAAQSFLRIGLVDLVSLPGLDPTWNWMSGVADQNDVLLFDTVDDASLQQVGALLYALAGEDPVFVAGSSGIEYALVAAWRALGLLPVKPSLAPTVKTERLFSISGSCSAVTEKQIHHALKRGFEGLHIDPRQLIGDESAVERVINDSVACLSGGKDLIVYTAAQAADRVQTETDTAFNDQIGMVLGRILNIVLSRTNISRAVVAGGDTSSHALRQLGVTALTFAAPLVPGCPLCCAHSDFDHLDGLEIALKGGQMGQDDFFLRAKGIMLS